MPRPRRRKESAFYDFDWDGGNKLFRKTKCKVGIFLHVTLVLIRLSDPVSPGVLLPGHPIQDLDFQAAVRLWWRG